MQISFTGHQIEITSALREFATEKFERLQRHFERITSANVVFTVNNLDHVAEATIRVPGESLHASSKATDMYSAIDALVDKLDRQLKKHKEKSDNYR
jgi:putative sigma-54 modulation protein